MRKNGFTLIEILLAIFILEIGLLALGSFYSFGFRVIKIARMETTAANLASGLLDQELEKTYDNLAVGTGTKVNYSTDPADPFYGYQKKVDITYIDSNLAEQSADTNMKKVVVTVYWQLDTEKSLTIASIKARH